MAKKMIFGDEARAAMKQGIDQVAQAVRITMGPRGRNVAFDRGFGGPTITNDGVSIAKEIVLADKFENMGAEILKEVADKMNKAAGDGTTTATVLAHAMITEGMKYMRSGMEVMTIKRGIDAATQEIMNALKTSAKSISTSEETKQVATVSVENEGLGIVIAETIEKVGANGVVTVEEASGFDITSEVVEGLSFDRGYASPYMVTDVDRQEAVFENPYILVTDKKVDSIKDIVPLLEAMLKTGKKDLVIIADDFSGDTLPTFVINKLRGVFNVLAIKAPGFGDRKKEQLGDIAAVVGATLITDDAVAMKWEELTPDVFGGARKVIASKDKTVIVDGKGAKIDIDARIAQLKSQAASTKSGYDKEKIDERIAKLSGGVAIIRVGAATETEMKYLKLKIEDAVNATKAALEEGIVAGGGSALVMAAQTVGEKFEKSKDIGEELAMGYRIVLNACRAPLQQIAVNAGHGDGSAVVAKVSEMGASAGFNAGTNTYVADMVAEGIIDPVKVTRNAVFNAASAAGTFLTTEVAIADIPEPKDSAAAHGGMGGMDY